jgi:U4/U6.U5 tri-snRNP-associated protein 1
MKPQGLKIGHSADEIQADSDLILTLRDSSVLDSSAVLENSLLTEQFRTAKVIEARKLVRSGGILHEYSGEDTGERVILRKYDDPLTDGKERGIELDETGNAHLSVAAPTKEHAGESLNVPKTVAADYGTFRRPKKRPRGADIVPGLQETSRTSMRDRFLANAQNTAAASIPTLEEDDKDLEQSLSRQLRAVHKQRKESEPAPIPTVLPVQEGEVFSATREFVEAVASEKERLEAKRLSTSGLSLKDSASGSTSVVNVALPSERLIQEAAKEPTPVSEPTPTPEAQPSLTQELYMGRGLAECLQLLRQRAALKPSKKKFGRSTDIRKEGNSESTDDIPLEYRDEKGRLLSTRQAFRQQCYSFHNEQPGKNKVDKLLKRAKLEEDRAALDQSKGGATFRAQKDVMAKTKQPFVLMPAPK